MVAVIFAVTCVGCVMVAVAVRVHPFASVTVTVYVPFASPVAVAPVPPDGAQLYVYPPAPPPAVTVAEPFVPPKQETFVVAVIFAVTCVGCEIVVVAVCVHPPASVTSTVYVPTPNPVAVAPVPPEGVQLYVYPPEPPLAVTVADPFVPPKQETFVVAVIFAVGAPALAMVVVAVRVHPFASVTVTV